MTQQIRCVIMRGGTSKGIFLRTSDLPQSREERDRAILAIFGSPDKRQIDGLGGADPLTSKLALIGPPPENNPRAVGAHLTYTFGQVEIGRAEVDWHSLCGNISAAVGAFAVYEGYVQPVSPITRVKVYNTNLDRMLHIEVPVENGKPVEKGDYTVPGVPGNGAMILIDFSETAGAATGSVLSTGNAVDRLDVPGFGPLDMSLVDTGNAHVFIRASDIGLKGTETAAEIDARLDLLDLLERIRGVGAARMGMITDAAASREESPATPLLGIVSPPEDYHDALGNRTIKAQDLDFVSRVMFMQQVHKTYAGTSTVCTGVAARIAGTVVHEMARAETRNRAEVRIGHPAGVIETQSLVSISGNEQVVERATLGRTARRIMEGSVFIP